MSATLGASPEPEQPSQAVSHSDPVQSNPVQDKDFESPIAMTALAEPEAISQQEPTTDKAASGSSMIVFEGVGKVYEPGVTALEGVGFTIDKGEFVFVVGASGSGKSTVIRLLLKEIEP